MNRILISGFEPFDNNPINPSQQLIQQLRQTQIKDVELKTILLPVDTNKALPKMEERIQKYDPHAILMFGVYVGATTLRLEQQAINTLDFDIPDNQGNIIQNQPIIPNGEKYLSSTLPLDRFNSILLANNIPVVYSTDAGKYLCNQLMYGILHYIKSRNTPIPAGFIHLPASMELATQNIRDGYDYIPPSMDLERMLIAATLMIKEIAHQLFQGKVN